MRKTKLAILKQVKNLLLQDYYYYFSCCCCCCYYPPGELLEISPKISRFAADALFYETLFDVQLICKV